MPKVMSYAWNMVPLMSFFIPKLKYIAPQKVNQEGILELILYIS